MSIQVHHNFELLSDAHTVAGRTCPHCELAFIFGDWIRWSGTADSAVHLVCAYTNDFRRNARGEESRLET